MELENTINKENINSYNYNEFSSFKRIGKGGYGTVYKSKWKNRELIVALKKLNVELIDKKTIRKELKNLQKVCTHPNIIKFYGVTRDPSKGSYNIILQFANNGDLRTYLKENFSNLEWIDKFRMAYEISNVHEKRMLIADFGLSKDETSKTSNSNIGGVAPYIDPKCFECSEYKRGKKSDIFSFGVILWEISSGKPPFQSANQEYYIQVQRCLGKREERIEGTPELYFQLYEKCWDGDPNKRPRLDDISEKLKDLWIGEAFESILRTITLKIMFIKFINSIKVFKNHVYWNYSLNQHQSIEEFSKKS
ncbi:kinase-like domain-containing protein [Gigaspora rosea]|uniref:Kinase-like domain-containing protein n=1 Tax=Gigaspora rosea TaxID=44941 RepID=A0A397USL9_9GLOM|nr:kinase-like domain-containing protein [Gigaspora rosea]